MIDYIQAILDSGRCPQIRDLAGNVFEVSTVRRSDGTAGGFMRFADGASVFSRHSIATIDDNLVTGQWVMS